MATDNQLLATAKRNKKDEFYTQMSDIEKEMKNYLEHFKDKHVFCNCDDPEFSNFWRYFALNFKRLGLKRLTSTHFEDNGTSYRMDMYREVPEEAKTKKTFLTLEEIGIDLPLGYITDLKENGDFRSEESLAILKECDIVVTNPPFSLFREYVSQLIEYEKDFIIIGNVNAITYKETFLLIKENKIWLGPSISSGDREFRVPQDYPLTAAGSRIDEYGNKYIRVKGVRWFTNLDHNKRHEELILYKSYTSEEYPTYDNYNAINVNKVKEIPVDYDGVMGVPITFMDKYNPDQFEILGLSASAGYSAEVVGIPFLGEKDARPLIDNKNIYARIFIKKKGMKNEN